MTSRTASDNLQALARLGRRLVLDGELVADAGRAGDFYRLGPNLRSSGRRDITFVAFDLLVLDDENLCARPYSERRQMLEELDLNGPGWCTIRAARRSTRRLGAVAAVVQAEGPPEGQRQTSLDAGYTTVARSVVMETNRIAAFPAFANLPVEELNEFAGPMREVEVEAGATVIRADDYGTAIYLIEAGEADVLNDARDAIKALDPGDAFGEIGLLLTGRRETTVVARTPMRLLSLSGQDFDLIRPQVPEVERVLRRLALDRAGQ